MLLQRRVFSSGLLGVSEPLVTASKGVPLVTMKTDVMPSSSRSFSSLSLRRYNALPLTYNSFSTPRRFFSDRTSFFQKISETKEIEDPELIAGQDDAIKEFIERVDINHLPFEIRERSIRAVKYYNDSIFDIQEKGRAEGLLEGEVKGRTEGLLEGEVKGRAEGLLEGEVKTLMGLINKRKLTLGDVMQSDDYSKEIKMELEKRLRPTNG
jgi:hypothetical protein